MRFIYSLPLVAASLFAATPSESVLELYTNASFLKQKFDIGSGTFETTVPAFVTLEKLQLKSPCTIEEKKLTTALKIDDTLQMQIEEAINAKEVLQREEAVILAKHRLLTTLKLDKTPLENVEMTTDTFGTLILANLEAQATLKTKIKEANKAIQDLVKKRDSFKAKNLIISFTCKGPGELETLFPLQGISANKLIRFEADTKDEELTLSQSAFIRHALGEDLQNLTLRMYSFAFNRSVAPIPFRPRYIGINPPVAQRMMAKSVMMDAVAENSMAAAPAREIALSTKRVWEATNVSLPTGEKTEVIFNKQNLPASFSTEIDGYGTASAYAKVSFTPEKSIEAGQAMFVLDGVLIAKRYLNHLKKEKKANLFFGKNDHINVEKELLKDYTDESIFGGKQTTEKLWKYTITNRSVETKTLSFQERLPISKHEDIVIKPLGEPQPNSLSIKGKALWSFTLEPGASQTLTFGYAITKPVKK